MERRVSLGTTNTEIELCLSSAEQLKPPRPHAAGFPSRPPARLDIAKQLYRPLTKLESLPPL